MFIFYNLYYEIKTFDTQIDAIWNLKFVELLNLMITIWLRIGGYNKEKRPIVDFSMQNEVTIKKSGRIMVDILITGANRGLGLGFVEVGLEKGYRVFAGVRDPNEQKGLN